MSDEAKCPHLAAFLQQHGLQGTPIRFLKPNELDALLEEKAVHPIERAHIRCELEALRTNEQPTRSQGQVSL